MSKRKTWADVNRGDMIELAGQQWHVTKLKLGKKKAHIVLNAEESHRRSEGDVKLSDRVKIVKRANPHLMAFLDKIERGPVQDAAGTQQRWATKRELEATVPGLQIGDPKVTEPPAKPVGDLWETPAGKIERRLDDLLSARLVGEATDEGVGYYVPPVDVGTVAAHLAIFHGGQGLDDDHEMMLGFHRDMHDFAAAGSRALPVNHWHVPNRP